MKNKKNKSSKAKKGNKQQSRNTVKYTTQSTLVEGIVDMTKLGNAFVICKNLEKDILILADNVNGAMNKDTVKVKIIKYTQDRPYGSIVKIIKRNQDKLIGFITTYKNKFFFKIKDTKNKNELFEILNANEFAGLTEEQAVLVKISPRQNSVEILELLNTENQNNIILNNILSNYNFEDFFSEKVLEACQHLNPDFDFEAKDRIDFRQVSTFTIDPNDAKDFDDALSIQILDNQHIQIGIHIADVSHFVQPNSDLDKEAYKKATSVYMPGLVSPMLPQKLSNNLCSLVPNQDRLTFATIVEFKLTTQKAKIVNVKFSKTIINSNKRFTYQEVQNIIKNKTGEFSKDILQLYHIASLLRAERIKNGSIKFASVELNFVLDENNFPTEIKIKESKEANFLVEEFMLLANQEVAKYLNEFKANVFIPYRVHDAPDEKKIDTLSQYIRRFGYSIETSTKEKLAQSLNIFLDHIKDKIELSYLEKLAIRSMAKAQYSTNNIGHYGLGFQYYCHFTSPIRRYPDIMVHRALSNVLHKSKKNLDQEKIEIQCAHCNKKEIDAVEAEREAIKFRQVQYMSKFIGEEFEAIITGVASFGIWAETLLHKCEGMIRISDLLLIDDFYFKQEEFCIIGKHTNKILRMGDTIKIQVVSAKVLEKELDFIWVQ